MSGPTIAQQTRPWAALWAIIIGYFMILVDATIVTVAIPTISTKLHTDTNTVIWVTSAYLLAYAVPLLVAGRLGDRFGPKSLYQLGLALFTLASLGCGLSTSIGMLITARAVQGVGAALMTPQTLTVITRLFPPQQRGPAMSVWGATAGAATLVGPILGGLLVGAWGWEWIFYVNIPVGIAGFILAQRLLPKFTTTKQRLDTVGVFLSGAGLLLVVFGIQEGGTYNWGTIRGPITVWSLIVVGAVFLVAFILWEARQGDTALMPLRLFRNRSFALPNTAITAIGFAITIFALPIILWAQDVHRFTTIQSALLLLPMAVVTVALSPIFGQKLGQWSPRLVASFGVVCFIGGLTWLAWTIGHNSVWPATIAPSALIGVANASMWGALSVAATQDLDPRQAGAGSGVFNATRQFGSVLGSAAIAAMIDARITANFPAHASGANQTTAGPLPAFLHAPFAEAMGESLLLPAAVLVLALLACLTLPRTSTSRPDPDPVLPR